MLAEMHHEAPSSMILKKKKQPGCSCNRDSSWPVWSARARVAALPAYQVAASKYLIAPTIQSNTAIVQQSDPKVYCAKGSAPAETPAIVR